MVTPLAALTDSMFSPKSALRPLFLFAFLLSAATVDSLVTFPSFSPDSHGDFFTFGDAAYNLANRSYIINVGARTPASKGSCGVMVYGKPVRIQNAATGSVASFSISFSFTFTTHGLPWDNWNNPLDGSAFGFTLIPHVPMTTMADVVSQLGKFGACLSYRSETDALTPPRCSVRFDTDYRLSPNHDKEPSNNFIRVARNIPFEYDFERYTHNLCGNDTHCTYFSNGRTFTAWIDFTSSSQTLEIRMANGSNAKPLKPLLLISNYEFPKSMRDEVLVAFWGSSDVNHREEHELLSLSFFSTEISESKLHMMLHYWKSRTGVGITTGGVLVGTMAALVILWSIYSFATPSTSYSALGYSTGPHVFSYNELRKETENFDERNLLGRGGSGLVYKGSLEGGGVLVAVKQINMSESKQAESLFHAEVASLGQIRHRNVVRLYGWCQEKGKLLLVYEYMSNGTLNHWLHENGSQQVLSLKMRHSILEGVGAALEYLHEDCSSCILHRDIKSSNVLLDADFKAYVGDFGLARLMDHHKLDKTTLAAGTFSYMAPELPYTGKATKESDVYSFGILVLEVVCGRHPLDLRTIEPEDLVLLFTVWQAHEGITPYATLYHWDLPQTLDDEYRGWIDRRIVNDFAEYAEVCFSSFGDRVKQWLTINEPQQFSCLGYGIGIHAPGRCSDRTQSAEGNSATEPYLVVHHTLLAHATVFDLYKRKFKPTQGGTLGMAVDCQWGEALTSSQVDKEAAERFVQFQLGWLLDPIYFGDYPAVMRKILGDRLPRFTRDEIALLSGSLDFVAVNHYTSRFISDGVDPQSPLPYRDREVKVSVERNGSVIGNRAASNWLYIVPWGLGKVLTWITKRYNRPQLFVAENGMDDADDVAKPRPLEEMLSDTARVAFYEDYLRSALQSIRDGADVRGYFAWTLLDNFEWSMGYSNRFGLIYVDYKNKQKRYPKTSALWYSQFLKRDPEVNTGLTTL